LAGQILSRVSLLGLLALGGCTNAMSSSSSSSGSNSDSPTTSSGNERAFVHALTVGESYGGKTDAVNNKGNKYQATGALQFIRVTAEESMRNGCPDPRVGSLEEQVAATVFFLRVFHPNTLNLVNRGAVTEAIYSISGRWPSVPGGRQQNVTFAQFCRRFLQEGGTSPECSAAVAQPAPVAATPPPAAYVAPQPSYNTGKKNAPPPKAAAKPSPASSQQDECGYGSRRWELCFPWTK
jgi:hypothetical protein